MHVQEQEKWCHRDIPLPLRLVQKITLSNICFFLSKTRLWLIWSWKHFQEFFPNTPENLSESSPESSRAFPGMLKPENSPESSKRFLEILVNILRVPCIPPIPFPVPVFLVL